MYGVPPPSHRHVGVPAGGHIPFIEPVLVGGKAPEELREVGSGNSPGRPRSWRKSPMAMPLGERNVVPNMVDGESKAPGDGEDKAGRP